MQVIFKQSVLVMGWAVVGSQVVTYTIVNALAPEFLDASMQISPAISAVVAAPLTYLFFRQNVRLEEANRQLEDANRELGRETAIAKREATLDPMTHLLNRTYFVKTFEEKRNSEDKPGFFLMLDADNFKQINDNYGHIVGDDVLIKITNLLKMTLREDDIAGRLGGEEFGVYLRGVTRQQALDVAERIRSRIAETDIDVGTDTPYRATVSIGAVFAARQHDVTQLMHMADRNLYRAKSQGRNTIVFDAFKGNEGVYSAIPIAAAG